MVMAVNQLRLKAELKYEQIFNETSDFNVRLTKCVTFQRTLSTSRLPALRL